MANQTPPKPIPKPGRVTVYRALYDYKARSDREMSFNEGDLLYVTDSGAYEDWLTARYGGRTGLVPKNYVQDAECIALPLHEAAKRGNLNFIKECLDNSVSPNSLDKSGSTPLYWASYAGHTDIVKLLVEIPNMCISAQNKLGDTALHAAAWKSHADCVEVLLEHGANPSIRNYEGKMPFDIARDTQSKALLEMAARKPTDAIDNEYESNSSEEEVAEEL
uniref:Osteoclast-stimulating factor 1 n=1 Tax=Syphacia muris TaxID=451379 RepID=A0A0N5AMY4_9BILA